jgi:hypothetical protein
VAPDNIWVVHVAGPDNVIVAGSRGVVVTSDGGARSRQTA